MATGLASGLADGWLNTIRGGGAGTTFTAAAVQALKLHTNAGDPGAAGTSNASANTTRQALTMGASASGGGGRQIALSNSPTWSSWASGSETIGYFSDWDSTTAGAFQWSAALTTPKAVANGDTLTVTSVTVALTPIAA